MQKLSPSRLKTLQNCGILFWNTYKRKEPLPRGSNSGANRGSVTHFLLECLIRPDRKERVKEMLAANDPWVDAASHRLANIHADKLGVGDWQNLEMIRSFILTALQNDFYGEEFGASEVLVEHEFDIKTDKFWIGGFIDKIFVSLGINKGVDYKTSKAKFTGEDVSFNLQNYTYTLAIREKYPNQPSIFEFQFLKFPKKPIQDSPVISDAELEGFKIWLGEMSEFIDNMTFEDAKAFSAKNGGKGKSWLCGAPANTYKENGEKKFTCEMRFPYVYFALLGEGGKFIKSDKEKSNLEKIKKEGQVIESRFYEGCPCFKYEWQKEP